VYFKLSNDMIVSPLQLAQLVKFNQNWFKKEGLLLNEYWF
jgi:hypothetical protein